MSSDTKTTTTTEQQSNRGRVRHHLIEPLVRDGMVRDRRTSAADHTAFLDRLADRLGYLSDDNLRRMRVLLMSLATGSARNVWPGWVTIWNQATGLQTPPDDKNPIMQTWLHSRRGPALRDAGQLVETYLFLRDTPRPPSDYEQRQIAETAQDNARRRTRVVAAIKDGHASDDDRAWLTWYDRTAQLCEDIVNMGIRHRKAQGEGE